MGTNERATIIVDGDVSPLRQKMREAGESLKQFSSEGEQSLGRMTGPLKTLQSRFVAIGALLAGGSVFRDAIAQTVKFTEESTKLGRALGISASSASVLREALVDGNTSQEEFIGAAQMLGRQIRANEEGLQAMGLSTRDAAGQLRPLNDLVLDAIGVMNQYRAGTDRALAGQVLFGRGFQVTSNLAALNKTEMAGVRQSMADLGMTLTAEGVAGWKAYDDATDKATLTLTGIKTAIGNALMPALTELATWFSSIGPAAIVGIRGAVGGLVAAFLGLNMSVRIAWETIKALVFTVAEPIRALGDGLMKFFNRDYEGASQSLKNIGPGIKAAWSKSFDEIEEKARTTRDQIWNLFATGTPTAVPDAGGKSGAGLIKPGATKAAKAESSQMPVYEARLAEIKNVYEQENNLRQFSKAQELAYWQETLAAQNVSSKDRISITRRTAALELDIRREAARSQREIDAIGVESRRNAALAQVDIDEQSARFAEETSAINKEQLIALEEQFARRRFEIESQALADRIELAQSDPTATPEALARLNEQRNELDRSYLLRRRELLHQAVMEERSLWAGLSSTISGLWDKGIQALMNGTLTWRNATQAVGAEMVRWFAVDVVGAKVKAWAAHHAIMLAQKLGFITAEKAAQLAGSSATAEIKTAEAGVVVAANAAEAGSGSAASLASIPFAGPALALAAMATVFAAVMALSKTKSAARGYDIPRGLNPMTQLHEEEMVLPQKYADVIRGMAGGGEEGAAPASSMTVNISALDQHSIRRFLANPSNQRGLYEAVARHSGRRFGPRSS